MSDTAMPTVNAEFGAYPQISFPTPEAPAGLYCEEIVEGDGPMVRKGDIVTVNYHGVIWGKDKPFDSSFDRHQPIDFGIGVGQVIKGWDNTVPGHNVGSRLVVSIPPQYGYGSYGVPQAGIGGTDTLVFVIDIISTTSAR
ncbi:FKBP-type peptidyl-prolyl cis-trans isomerase [Alloscardovia theropitheci]|uniref:Peptidyl-prolyl cis-trans isomerase n=1 Tax=Alloscardovia theropitheci TaxID=2496842 RepID=A0A4R0QMX0_9BIFI|nr:FKBP-type peptidyl-prolyl cis-trans isomerase [Alloscardovia theropitheci]TCD53522.1 FKBP-type peptidyl-prolyl cis-trans isomerase [Alloscardovia theropitheci]